jgi:hypothetical protein
MLEVMWKLVIKQPTIQYHSHFPLPPIQSQLQSSHCGAVTELESPLQNQRNNNVALAVVKHLLGTLIQEPHWTLDNMCDGVIHTILYRYLFNN